MNTLILESGEFCIQGGVDLQSCFNIFHLLEAWWGFFTFEKKAALGGEPTEDTYVSISALAMGWTTRSTSYQIASASLHPRSVA